MARESEQLDTVIKVVTPENIAFDYRIAGPMRRFVAYLLDMLICAAAAYGVGLLVIPLTNAVGLVGFGLFIYFVVLFLLFWFYGGLLETLWNGQTVGKRMMGLRVLSFDGQRINAMQAIMRNILRFVDSLPFFTALLGLLVAMMNRRFQRLGDLACGTMVVVEEKSWLHGLMNFQDAAVVQLAAALPARFETPKSLAQAVAAYAERRKNFSPGRRNDIARHLAEPLRVKFGLPPDTNHDMLLCALYHRTFVADQDLNAAPGIGPPAPAIGPPAPVPRPIAPLPVIDVSIDTSS
jgi:uncharacterized RDD family membrane protein YckC